MTGKASTGGNGKAAQDAGATAGPGASTSGQPTTKRLLIDDYIALYQARGHALAICDTDDRMMHNGQPLTDTIEATILGQVGDYGILKGKGTGIARAKQAIHVMGNRHRYHPVRRYVEGLTWDGHDHIAKLCTYLQEPTPGVFAKWFTHWLVGAVARIYEPWQTPVLVIEGGQELGKSYFAGWLCPDPGLFFAGPVYPDDRDSRIRRMSVWLWEIEELGSTTRRQDQDALKAFITSTMILDRQPYGHYDVRKPALTSFIGTLNNDAGFLLDRTGNRRFLVAPLIGINWAYAQDVDRDQLWAQAAARYHAGDDWHLTDVDRRDRDAQNDEYMMTDPVELRLTAHYKFTGNWADQVVLNDVVKAMKDDGFPYSRSVNQSIGSVFAKWGGQKARPRSLGRQVTVYQGITHV